MVGEIKTTENLKELEASLAQTEAEVGAVDKADQHKINVGDLLT